MCEDTPANVLKSRTFTLFRDPHQECAWQPSLHPQDAMMQNIQEDEAEGGAVISIFNERWSSTFIHSFFRAGRPVLGLHGLLPDAGPHGNPLLDKLLGCSGTSDQEVGSAGPAPTLHRPQAGPGSWETPLSHPDPGWDLALSSLLMPVVTSSSWDLGIQ